MKHLRRGPRHLNRDMIRSHTKGLECDLETDGAFVTKLMKFKGKKLLLDEWMLETRRRVLEKSSFHWLQSLLR